MRAKNNVIAYIFSLLVELVFLAVAIFYLVGEYNLKFGWVETEAQVTDAAPPSNDFLFQGGIEFSYTYTDCILSYKVDGKVYEHEVRFDNDDPNNYYTTLPIKYNPKKPNEYILKENSENSFYWTLIAIIIPISMIGNIIAIIVNVKRYKKRKAERMESEQGYKLN